MARLYGIGWWLIAYARVRSGHLINVLRAICALTSDHDRPLIMQSALHGVLQETFVVVVLLFMGASCAVPSLAGPVSFSVLHGESSKRLGPLRNTKDRKRLRSTQRPSTGTTHRPSTRHYRKGSPGVKTHHNTNKHNSRARLQHSNHPPSSPTPNRVITRSSQPTHPAAKHRQAEPHYNTDTTRLSGDMQRPPPGGPIIKSGRWTVKGTRRASGKGKR